MKKKLSIGVLMSLSMLIATIANASYYFNGHNYWIVDATQITWNDAEQSANNYGGYLASITNSAEQTFIDTILPSSGEMWLGGYQTASSGDPNANWVWITGEEWNYTNWSNGEPNDNYGYASEEHLAIWCSSRKWNDEGKLSNITGYVVEASVPIPAALWLLGSGLASLAGIRIVKRKK